MTSRIETGSQIFERYLARHAAADLEGVIALFADDATVEDPVGSPIHDGIDAIRGFYRETHARNGVLDIERVGPILIGGAELAAHVRARLASPEAPPAMDVIYSLCFDEEGRIVALRAFF